MKKFFLLTCILLIHTLSASNMKSKKSKAFRKQIWNDKISKIIYDTLPFLPKELTQFIAGYVLQRKVTRLAYVNEFGTGEYNSSLSVRPFTVFSLNSKGVLSTTTYWLGNSPIQKQLTQASVKPCIIRAIAKTTQKPIKEIQQDIRKEDYDADSLYNNIDHTANVISDLLSVPVQIVPRNDPTYQSAKHKSLFMLDPSLTVDEFLTSINAFYTMIKTKKSQKTAWYIEKFLRTYDIEKNKVHEKARELALHPQFNEQDIFFKTNQPYLHTNPGAPFRQTAL